MATYYKCANCGYKIKLPFKARSQVPLVYFVKCPKCGYLNVVTPNDVEEENVFHFQCPVCGKALFVEGKPPFKVRCPLCKSVLEIDEKGNVKVIKKGEPPKIKELLALLGALARVENPLAGLLGGFFVGLLLESFLKYEGEAEKLE